ncbi:hypothetical protein DFH09DRAFT_1368540 [Mycena vulgaris]|nr:hypothetical protein DFH09DRAFT_1368540 [Mycena vulgaris]
MKGYKAQLDKRIFPILRVFPPPVLISPMFSTRIVALLALSFGIVALAAAAPDCEGAICIPSRSTTTDPANIDGPNDAWAIRPPAN